MDNDKYKYYNIAYIDITIILYTCGTNDNSFL